MNEHDLFLAIGQADDAYLLELEQPKRRRIPKHVGLIAAVFALVLTACAAPVVIRSFDKLEGGSVLESDKDMVLVSQLLDGTVLETATFYLSKTAVLDVAVEPGAPDTIEQHYIPLKLLEFCGVDAYTDEETLFSIELSIKAPKKITLHGLLYQQHILPEDGHIEVTDILPTGILAQSYETFGNVSALVISGQEMFTDGEGHRIYESSNTIATFYTKHIFWSDGMYLYCLKLPMTYPIDYSKLEEIVTSLTAVEDITEYLPAAE